VAPRASKLLASSFLHCWLRGTLEQSWIAEKERKIVKNHEVQVSRHQFRHLLSGEKHQPVGIMMIPTSLIHLSLDRIPGP
jgi:hypothetical protein